MTPQQQTTTRKWTSADIRIINANPDMTLKELAEMLNTNPAKVSKFKQRLKHKNERHLPIL
jgi:hypothetical protein